MLGKQGIFKNITAFSALAKNPLRVILNGFLIYGGDDGSITRFPYYILLIVDNFVNLFLSLKERDRNVASHHSARAIS